LFYSNDASQLLAFLFLFVIASASVAQEKPGGSETTPEQPKKVNVRPLDTQETQLDPFASASVQSMGQQCVTLETEAGSIEIEMLADSAPESARSFLNLAATGALDTTVFNRIVKDFIIQGGNLTTSQHWGEALSKRMSRKLPDEPSLVKHLRGIVSMARPDEPNSATTHFFILVGDGHHLNGKFSAFGQVTKGMEVADAINQAPAVGEKPEKPVRINRAVVATCKP
jgi:peptidyl-prolyl cis-trans isomerase B (cyclophilin B)